MKAPSPISKQVQLWRPVPSPISSKGADLETSTIPNFLKGARFWRPEPDVVFTHFCITRKQNIPFLFFH